ALRGVAADGAEVGLRLIDVLADDGAGFQDALHQLRLQAVGELAPRGLLEHRLDAGHQVEGAAAEEHVLLLHPDRQRRPLAEPVVEHARRLRRRAAALPGCRLAAGHAEPFTPNRRRAKAGLPNRMAAGARTRAIADDS